MIDISKIKLTEEKFAEIEATGFNAKEKAYIRKVGNEWCIFSETGKNLGCKPSKKAAEDRLKEIEMFKHMKAGTELATFECYCEEEGIYFLSSRRCDLQRCPESGDDAIEVTGEF